MVSRLRWGSCLLLGLSLGCEDPPSHGDPSGGSGGDAGAANVRDAEGSTVPDAEVVGLDGGAVEPGDGGGPSSDFPVDGVTVLGTQPCADRLHEDPGNLRATCVALEVDCVEFDEAPRMALLRMASADATPTGAHRILVLTTGGDGGDWYYTGEAGEPVPEDRSRIMAHAYEAGATTVELRWASLHLPGLGYRARYCGAALVFEWIAANVAHSPASTICAQGNSNGSSQIAFALGHWGAERLLDSVMLSAGPPQYRVDAACHGDGDDSVWTTPWDEMEVDGNDPGRAGVDTTMGWDDSATRCQDDGILSPDRVDEARSDGPLGAGADADYTGPEGTVVRLYEGEADPTRVQYQALGYFEQLGGTPGIDKHFELYPDVPHDVNNHPEVIADIQAALDEDCL